MEKQCIVERSGRLLRLRDALSIFPVSRAAWYAGIREGRYPAPVRISPRCVAWRLSDIERLIEKGGA